MPEVRDRKSSIFASRIMASAVRESQRETDEEIQREREDGERECKESEGERGQKLGDVMTCRVCLVTIYVPVCRL